jgi:hypothetical protein
VVVALIPYLSWDRNIFATGRFDDAEMLLTVFFIPLAVNLLLPIFLNVAADRK